MKKTPLTLAAVAVSVATLAFAHNGATGIVKQRMDGMSAMGKATKQIAPMMRGVMPYDAQAVKNFAATVQMHSGTAMTELFPQGTGGMPSEAKPSVWSDWADFAALAMRLEVLGEGLAQAAENGLATGADTESEDLMGLGNAAGSMMGTGDTGGGMMGEPRADVADLDALAQMPADKVFARIGKTCSACHTKFRAESN